MAARGPRSVDGANDEPQIDIGWIDAALAPNRRRHPRLPIGRRRDVLLLGLLAAAAVLLWLRVLASAPHLPVDLQVNADGSVVLQASGDPALEGVVGQRLLALVLADGRSIEASAAMLPRSPRWIVDDAERQQRQLLASLVAEAARQPEVSLQFAQGPPWPLRPAARGLGGLGSPCWAVGAMALALLLTGAVVATTQLGLRSALFAVMALSQSVNLLLIGADLLPGLGLPASLVRWALPLHLVLDMATAAALVHLMALYPERLTTVRWRAWAAWGLAASLLAWLLLAQPRGTWWWAQGASVAYGLVAVVQLRRRPGHPTHPLGRLLQRLVLAGVGTLMLLTLAIATAGRGEPGQFSWATVGSVIWVMFFASLLMLGPFLSRSQQVLREFMLLAGVATLATSLDLLFSALFKLHPLASQALALGLSLAAYALVRPWIQAQLAASGALSAERMFDSLYRAARALEQSPEQAGRQLKDLLREIFDPLEAARTPRSIARVRVAPDGSTMVVPIPHAPDAAAGAIVLRHARRGRRLFTQEDRDLCEQLLEQLRRAVAYDRAVEHGRTEERTRIAQDLHDDIGARLLTLMYKAPDAEIEAYIRHTLQDLKTLTRGLAASSHRLSHAAAEWKADISQRLSAGGCDLHWSFSTDSDPKLTVVQWSALTRVMRELVNNILTHAQATQVDIVLNVDRGQLTLDVSDDGNGRSPQAWSHGLGLGGVRKRVKLLGGQVQWVERDGRGIRCEVRAPLSGELP